MTKITHNCERVTTVKQDCLINEMCCSLWSTSYVVTTARLVHNYACYLYKSTSRCQHYKEV